MRVLAAVVLMAAACGSNGEVTPDAAPVATLPYANLSQYHFFVGTGATQEPMPGVIPYDVIAPLFADFAGKDRFIALPAGGKITYAADDKWGFPTGTMLIKSFGFGDQLVETRVLIKQASGWLPTTYLWNADHTDAVLSLAGSRVPVTYTDASGNMGNEMYLVPNQNQCYECHGQPGVTNVLGLRTRQLNHDNPTAQNQIDRFVTLGMFDGAVPAAADRAALADPYGDAPVEPRARAWLEANCAHCHSPGGAAGATDLYLASDTTVPINLGICRSPNAAGDGSGGRLFDVVPGHPEQSVMTFRIASTVPGIKMPETPILLVDQRGVDVVTAWIAAMPEMPCQ